MEPSPESLEEALRSSDIAWWVLDPVVGDAFFSDGWYSLLGYSEGAFPMSFAAWVELVHPDDRGSAVEALIKAVESPEAGFSSEFRLKTSAGEWQWMWGRGKLVSHPGSSSVAGTCVDITAKKALERALAESQARWTNFVDKAPIGIALIDRDGVIQFVNRFVADFSGAAIVGRSWKEIIAHELHSEIDWVMRKAFLEGQPLVFESYRGRPDGRIVRFQNHVSPVTENGTVNALLVISLDITDQHQTRRRQSKAARRMEAVMALHHDFQFGRSQLFKTALEEALGLTDSVTGMIFLFDRTASSYALEAVSKDYIVRPANTFALGSLGSFDEAVQRRAPVVLNTVIGESVFHLGTILSPVLLNRYLAVPILDNGAVVAIIGVGNKILPYDDDDIEQVRMLIESLWHLLQRNEVEKLLARSQKMETVGQLAAGVAHDFNNLLTSTLTYNELLLRKLEAGNPLRAYAEGIERAGRRAADLVSGLLAFGRQQHLSKTRVDLGTLLKEEESLLSSLTHGRVRVEAADAGELEVEVDVGQINQVIVNLVSNARDATEEEGSLILVTCGSAADAQGRWAWFKVHDDGLGIPDAIQERIFEPFYTTKPIGKGTGLGLSIVHGIVEQHQGQITVVSGSGQGTTFTVRLPLLDKRTGKPAGRV